MMVCVFFATKFFEEFSAFLGNKYYDVLLEIVCISSVPFIQFYSNLILKGYE